MAEIDVQHDEVPPEDDYTMGDVIFWIIGILMIPLVPILMVTFLTPTSGM